MLAEILKIGQFVAVSDLYNLRTVNEASHLTDKQKKILIVYSQSEYNTSKVMQGLLVPILTGCTEAPIK